MTVKEIFELRKQGRIEEAYDAIRPMYTAHRGRYTTLRMFWTAADVFKLRLDQGRTDEAAKILEALKRMLPNVEAVNKELDTQAAAKATSTPAATSDKLPWEHDKPQQEGSSASAFIASATRRLAKIKKTSIVTNKSSINEKLTSNSRQLTSKEEASPLGNICDIRDICVTIEKHPQDQISVLSALSAGHKTTPHPEERTAAGGSNLPNLPDLAQQETDNPTGQIITRTDLNPGQRIVLACITAHPGYSVPQISASTGIPAKSIERHVAALIDKNLIEHRGSKKTGGYHAL